VETILYFELLSLAGVQDESKAGNTGASRANVRETIE
jgi:hypothetical protein